MTPTLSNLDPRHLGRRQSALGSDSGIDQGIDLGVCSSNEPNGATHGVSERPSDVEANPKPDEDPWLFYMLNETRIMNLKKEIESEIAALDRNDSHRLKELNLELEHNILHYTDLLCGRRKIHEFETPYKVILEKVRDEAKECFPNGSADDFSVDPRDYVCLAPTSGLDRWLRTMMESKFGKYICAPLRRKTVDRKGSVLETYSDDAFAVLKWSIFVCVITAFSCVPVIIQTLSSRTSLVGGAICYVVFLFAASIVMSAMYGHMPTVSLMILGYGALCANNLRGI